MKYLASLLLTFTFATSALAQSTQIALGGLDVDQNAPLEVTSDSLSVNQDTGVAVFSGNVVIGQGTMRLSAAQVSVEYSESTGDISRLKASGGVTLVTDSDAAEAREADYNLDANTLRLSGDVLLTQGSAAISAQAMVINLATGTAEMSGRVRTILGQGNN